MIDNKVIVLDVSFWQDSDLTPYIIDFGVAWRNGADGVIIRAGQNSWPDEDYLEYCKSADRLGFPRGAYWFFDSRLSPVPQADLFADIVEGSGFPPLGIWGDYEEHYGGVYGGEDNFRIFMDRLQTRFPGKLVGVYTGPSYWTSNTTTLGRAYFKKFPLWIANYGVIKPSVPAPWLADEWTFWQFTDVGDGRAFGAESEEIDMNFFRGSLEEYKIKFNIPQYVPAPLENEPEGDMMYNCKVKETATPYINIRASVDQYSADLGNMYPNEEFQADNKQNDSSGRPWLHSIKSGKVGWVLASLCYYQEASEPTPEPESHVLEVYLDGVLEYRKEF